LEKSLYEAKFQLITREQLVGLGFLAVMVVLNNFNIFYLLLVVFVVLALGVSYFVRNQWTVSVYKDRVEFVSTFVRMNSRRLEASKIESVDVRDSLLGNKLYGTVTVRGSGTANLKFLYVKSQQELAERIRAISSAPQTKQTIANPRSTSNTGNLVSDLKELEQLKKDGVISEAEFQELKKKAIQGD
jgi:hypothetical protein